MPIIKPTQINFCSCDNITIRYRESRHGNGFVMTYARIYQIIVPVKMFGSQTYNKYMYMKYTLIRYSFLRKTMFYVYVTTKMTKV